MYTILLLLYETSCIVIVIMNGQSIRLVEYGLNIFNGSDVRATHKQNRPTGYLRTILYTNVEEHIS